MIARRHSQAAGASLLLAWGASALFAACAESAPVAPTATRRGRLGALRDLVLFERVGMPIEQSLLVDRFETTRSDWLEFAASPFGAAVSAAAVPAGGEAALPIARVDLRQARAFARWRCLRLPTRADFELASGAALSRFPWGDRMDASRANTGELGLFAATPVGTFESGRRAGGEQPYDLIGNVSEWTESVSAVRWCIGDADRVGSLQQALLGLPAAAAWALPGGVLPPAWMAALGGAEVPHDVVGSDFQSPMPELVEPVPAGEIRQRTGFRVCGTVVELVEALAALPGEPHEGELAQMRSFLQPASHRRAVLAALGQRSQRHAYLDALAGFADDAESSR